MVTSLDVSLLGGSASTGSAGTTSPYLLYRKLQQQAEQNADKSSDSSSSEALAEQIRISKNAGIRVRNAQAKTNNTEVTNDVTYFRNRVATATTVNELVNDDRVLKVIANAAGLGDLYTFNKSRLKAILTSDLTDANSVARQGSVAELELARKYNFGATGNTQASNGNTVTIDANGATYADGATGSAMEAGLAKIKGLTLDANGVASASGGGNLILQTKTVVISTGVTETISLLAYAESESYRSKKTKPLLPEEAAPAKKTDAGYEYAGEDFDRFRSRTDIKREEDYFKSAAKNIKSVDDLFADKRALRFLLDAYDLSSEAANLGKIRKIVESDLGDQNSLANRMQDPRFKQLASDLNIPMFGTTVLNTDTFINKTVTKFEQVKYEQSLDESAPGVRAAIEFKRRAQDVTKTVQLLGDSVLREVITVANNIPQQIAVQEVDAQVTAIERRFDVTKLKDPTEVDKIVARYLTFKDQGSGTSGTNSYLLNLFG